ncbi:MAG: hypothetical protein MHM6MM_003653 [Cercozoa sp. M6MM]
MQARLSLRRLAATQRRNAGGSAFFIAPRAVVPRGRIDWHLPASALLFLIAFNNAGNGFNFSESLPGVDLSKYLAAAREAADFHRLSQSKGDIYDKNAGYPSGHH